MQFTFAKELAEEQANENVRETVVTVPGWYGEKERRSILDAADIAGLRVVGLVNDGTAGTFPVSSRDSPRHVY
jgi:hypoxia up-regulated 1